MKFLLVVSFFVMLVGCNHQSLSLKIATSANTEPALKKIAAAFEKKFAISVDLVVSSSGALSTQIIHGAPFDIFVAANLNHPESLFEKGLVTDPPLVYATGKLVLWTLHDYSPSIDLLMSDTISKIAISNPKTAPYGKLTTDFLNEKGIFEKIKHKLVFGENVSQTNQFITTKSADIGFTSLSTVMSEKMRNLGHWKVFENLELPQGIVRLKNSKLPEESRLFFNFMFSKNAQSILVNHGYEIPQLRN